MKRTVIARIVAGVLAALLLLGCIALRKAHPALRMTSAEEINAKITNLSSLEFNVTGFHIAPGANGDESSIVAIFNPRSEATTVELPEGQWNICVSGDTAGTEVLGNAEGTVTVEAQTAMVLVQGSTAPAEQPAAAEKPSSALPVAILAAIAAVLFVFFRRKKK